MKRRSRNEKQRQRMNRRVRVARGITGTSRTRLTVYRSSKHIYAQLVDSESGRTLAATSSRSKQIRGEGGSEGKIEIAKRVGKAIAEIAREKEIEKVVFNRNGFLYHGRVKALAEAAREAGLQF